MRISDWSSDVCSSDLGRQRQRRVRGGDPAGPEFLAIGGAISRFAAVPARIAERVIGGRGGGDIGRAADRIGGAAPHRGTEKRRGRRERGREGRAQGAAYI